MRQDERSPLKNGGQSLCFVRLKWSTVYGARTCRVNSNVIGSIKWPLVEYTLDFIDYSLYRTVCQHFTHVCVYIHVLHVFLACSRPKSLEGSKTVGCSYVVILDLHGCESSPCDLPINCQIILTGIMNGRCLLTVFTHALQGMT